MKGFTICLLAFAVAISLPVKAQDTKTTADSVQNGKTTRKTLLILMGLTNIDQYKSFVEAMQKTRGIVSAVSPGFTIGQTSLQLNTSLTPGELSEAVKKWSPKSYFETVMSMDQMVSMVMTNKPVESRPVTGPPVTPHASTNPPGAAATVNPKPAEADTADNRLYTKLMDEALFPGGDQEWARYVTKNLDTNIPKSKGAPAGTYTVTVLFIVDKEGNISDVEAVNHPGYGIDDQAVKLVQKSPKWTPGINSNFGSTGGHPVRSYKKVQIKFVIPN